jgi:carboxyl-terminal processing protease
VQTIIPLAGHGAIRLTTARYYTPSGHSIQAKGIIPDIVVHQAVVEDVDQAAGRDEASLRNRLASEDELNGDEEAEAEAAEKTNGRSEQAKKDFQLTRALDLIHGLSLFNDRTVN